MRHLLTALALLTGTLLLAQQDNIGFSQANDGQTILTCDAFFIDSGGQGGSGYSNGESYTITLCPDTVSAGDNDLHLSTFFGVFELDTTNTGSVQNPDVDSLSIFDGPDASYPSLGSFTGDELQSLTISASSENQSGCLTFVFYSNQIGTGRLAGSAECDLYCDAPTALASIVNGATPDSIVICMGEEVTFDGSASFAAGANNIAEYFWDFGAGIIDTNSGAIASLVFNDAGLYNVLLTVTDDDESNPCSASTSYPLKVYVSNSPPYVDFPSDITMCLGESVVLTGIGYEGAYDYTWTNFTGMLPVEDGCLTDLLLGVPQIIPFNSNLVGTISSAEDLGDICVNMEHSFMGDLLIELKCPNGSSAYLQTQGGGGTQIGVPVQADNVDCEVDVTMGEGWTYCWNANETETWVDWVNNEGGGTLAEGSYASVEPLSELIGCPLQGEWQLIVIDQWAGDDGAIFEFGITFDSSFYTDSIQFITTVGEDADSSHWDLSDPYITWYSDDLNQISVQPEVAGVYEYNYWVVNNLGCEFDTTVTVEAIAPLNISAGPDFVVGCNESVQLLGNYEQGIPSCGNDSGVFTYCYQNNDELIITYCPDVLGDGITMMTMEFLTGGLEPFGDTISIYNGDSDSSPLIETLSLDDLTGLSYEADNNSGCITWVITSNESVSCEDSDMAEIQVSVSCTSIEHEIVWSWSPATGLSNPNIQNPIASVDDDTIYTLSAYPVGAPGCVSSDTMALSVSTSGISIDYMYGPIEYCIGQVSIFGVIEVEGAQSYEWTLPSGWTGYSETETIATIPGQSGVISVRAYDGCAYSEPLNTDVEGFSSPEDPEMIEGEIDACIDNNDTYTYTVNATADEYHWVVTGANVSELTSSENFIEILWEEEGLQNVEVFLSNDCGESETIEKEVLVSYCLGIDNDGLEEQRISIWPNPSTGIVNLGGELLEEGQVTVRVNNILGKEVMMVSIAQENHFDISHLPSGIYLLQLYLDDELTQVSRLIRK